MKNREIKDLPASIQRRLMNVARNSQRPYDEVLKYYTIERFLYRLGRSKYKGKFLLKQIKERGAEGVVFAAPSFCDPALLERPMLQGILAQHKIPYTAFTYAENTGQMAPIREQAGTFADSIKLWSAA